MTYLEAFESLILMPEVVLSRYSTQERIYASDITR